MKVTYFYLCILMTKQNYCTAVDKYNLKKKKDCISNKSLRELRVLSLFMALERQGMTDFVDVCTWIAQKHETKMVREMHISFSTALENNTTLFPNYTSK